MFADNDVVIPFDVIEELDKFKAGSDDLGRNARTVIRHLDRLRELGNLSEGVTVAQTGGRVRVVLEEDQKLCPGLIANTPDNRIICCAFALKQQGKRVVFITKDINARIKSDALGLDDRGFRSAEGGFRPPLHRLARSCGAGGVDRSAAFREKQLQARDLRRSAWPTNSSCCKDERDLAHTALGAVRGGHGRGRAGAAAAGPVFGIMPRNLQQTMALDLLLDESVKLVSLIGSAGTGKTLLAIAAGMTKVLNEQMYQKLLCARPIMPLGRDIGYLPGDKDEKLTAWMQPIFDNMAYLLSNRLSTGDGAQHSHASLSSVEQRIKQLMESGQVVLEPLTYIRGRSIPHQFMIVDEAQNLTPHEVKTIISRVGEGTKIVLTGDATPDRQPVPGQQQQRALVPRRAVQGKVDRRPRDAGQERTIRAGKPGDGGALIRQAEDRRHVRRGQRISRILNSFVPRGALTFTVSPTRAFISASPMGLLTETGMTSLSPVAAWASPTRRTICSLSSYRSSSLTVCPRKTMSSGTSSLETTATLPELRLPARPAPLDAAVFFLGEVILGVFLEVAECGGLADAFLHVDLQLVQLLALAFRSAAFSSALTICM